MSCPLQSLLYPWEQNLLPPPASGARVLILNAQADVATHPWPSCNVTVQQYFRPLANLLRAAGNTAIVEVPPADKFNSVLIFGGRQHEENLFYLATALCALKSGGTLIAAAANDAGGRRLAADLQSLGVPAGQVSKYKTRIVWTVQPERQDPSACAAALRAGDYQPGGDFISRPGIFCWDRIDAGSALLADTLRYDELRGRGADFGCGYGFLSRRISGQAAGVSELHAIDADARAVEACRRNVPTASHQWADITADAESLPQNLDWIVTNPPFHAGKEALPAIGVAFMVRAAQCLRPGGVLWLVANTGLPYEAVLAAHFTSCEKVRVANGYKIFRAVK